MRLATAFFWLSLVCCPAWAQLDPIHVFVLGIGEYDNYPALTSVSDRVDEIEAFFVSHYGIDPATQMHVAADRASTTEAGVHDLLDELRALREPSIVFFFLLSHGREAQTPHRHFSKDLLVVASNSSKELDKLDAEGIRGSDVFGAFFGLPAYSVVLAFVDTCESGVLASADAAALAASFKATSKRIVWLASSGDGEESYDFNFTKELISLWSNKYEGCKYAANVRDDLTQSLANQTPEVVADDNRLCLNAVNPDQALVFFTNRHGQSVSLEFRGTGLPRVHLAEREVNHPAAVNRASHTIQVYDTKSKELLRTLAGVDLVGNPVQLLTVFRDAVERNPYRPRSLEGGVRFGMQGVLGSRTPKKHSKGGEQ